MVYRECKMCGHSFYYGDEEVAKDVCVWCASGKYDPVTLKRIS